MRMRGWRVLPPLAAVGLAVASCSGGVASQGSAPARASALASWPASAPPRSRAPAGSGSPEAVGPGRPLPVPEHGQSVRAVYETTLVPPGGTQPAGIAWLDTGLLAARLYSGSVSPGGGPYRFTAPIGPAQAATLVAAFNGGFKMNQARGGYYTEGRLIDPLRAGAASLVIYADGSVNLGAWGRDVTMSRRVVSVRQNLLPLVAGGRPTPRAGTPRWRAWGPTCGATSCSAAVPGIEHQWR